MRKVPAIRDAENGLTLGESHAIIGYLSRKFKRMELLMPGGDELIFAKVE
jgi:glutathione S-transferase